MISGVSAMRCALVWMLVLACASLRAESFTMEQLLHSLAQVKSARAEFVEKKFLSIVDRPIESAGSLLYVAPNRLEKHTVRPRRESMILDRDELVIEGPAKQQIRKLSLNEYPVLRAFIESIRATLAGDAPALNRFYSTKLIGARERWQLVLVPRDTDTQKLVRAIHISGSADSIRSVEVLQNDGDRSLMTLYEEK